MATLLKRSLNPVKKFRETKGSPHARSYLMSFKQKCRDAFLFYNGNIVRHLRHNQNRGKQYFGILDYLFFPLSLLSYKCMIAADKRRPSDAASFFLFAASLIVGSPKYLVSSILTFLSLPFIGIAHGISQIKGRQLKNAFNNSPVYLPNPQPNGEIRETTITILSHLQSQQQNPRHRHHTFRPITSASITSKHNSAKLIKNDSGKITGFKLYIGRFPRNIRHYYPQDVLDDQGNIIHRAGDVCHKGKPVIQFDETLRGDQVPGMWAALKLNLGGVQKLVEKERAAGTEISKLFRY